MMGRYKAKLELWYGREQRYLGADAVFWVLPWPIIITLALIIGIFLYMTRKVHFAYMKWLWEQAKKLRWTKKE